MKPEVLWGTYGFRFNHISHLPLCYLFAVGHETAQHPSYDWNGMTRTDGPLLLFQYTVRGEGMLELGSSSIRLQAGQCFLVEIPGQHRYYYPPNKEPWEFYFLLIRPTTILPLWKEAVSLLGPTPWLDQESGPVRMAKYIFMEAQGGRISDPYTASSLVYQFVSELRRAALEPYRDKNLWPDSIKAAVQFIDENYSRMIGLDQLAARLDISKFHFLRIFTKHLGMTPNDYVNRRRIEESMSLLKTTNWSIDRIAKEIGYSSGSYYIKVFQKLVGQTPGSFRSGNHALQYSRLFFD